MRGLVPDDSFVWKHPVPYHTVVVEIIVCRDYRGGPLTTGRVTTGFDNGPVERGTFDYNFYTNSHLSKISVQN